MSVEDKLYEIENAIASVEGSLDSMSNTINAMLDDETVWDRDFRAAMQGYHASTTIADVDPMRCAELAEKQADAMEAVRARRTKAAVKAARRAESDALAKGKP